MMIFAKDTYRKEKIIIPLSRMFEIMSSGCSVVINYDSGEVIETEHGYIKKIETIKITLDSPDDVDKIIRQFYKACNNNAGAFYFGD